MRKKSFDFKVVWMISGDIKFVVAQDTERSGDDIIQAYAISISYVVRLSSSRRFLYPYLKVRLSCTWVTQHGLGLINCFTVKPPAGHPLVPAWIEDGQTTSKNKLPWMPAVLA